LNQCKVKNYCSKLKQWKMFKQLKLIKEKNLIKLILKKLINKIVRIFFFVFN
jgi:hypothetical protein